MVLITTEPGYYKSQDIKGSLYCDVLRVEVINDSTNFENIHNRAAVLKGYLFPPSSQHRSIVDFHTVIKKAEKTSLPVFIDATLPDPRMLYIASPMRLENVEERDEHKKMSFAMFTTAFPSEPDPSSEESESSDEETPPIRTSSLKMAEFRPFISRHLSISSLQVPDFKKTNSKSPKSTESYEDGPGFDNDSEHNSRRVCGISIYDDLNQRIKMTQQNIEDLCTAEISTYSPAASTRYAPPTKTKSLSLFSEKPSSAPSILSRLTNRNHSFQLPQLIISPENVLSSLTDYNHHLANYPVH